MDEIDKVYKPPGGCGGSLGSTPFGRLVGEREGQICGKDGNWCIDCKIEIKEEKRLLANIYEMVKLAIREGSIS